MNDCYFWHRDGYRYQMGGFDADMMLAVLNDHEPFYWGA